MVRTSSDRERAALLQSVVRKGLCHSSHHYRTEDKGMMRWVVAWEYWMSAVSPTPKNPVWILHYSLAVSLSTLLSIKHTLVGRLAWCLPHLSGWPWLEVLALFWRQGWTKGWDPEFGLISLVQVWLLSRLLAVVPETSFPHIDVVLILTSAHLIATTELFRYNTTTCIVSSSVRECFVFVVKSHLYLMQNCPVPKSALCKGSLHGYKCHIC